MKTLVVDASVAAKWFFPERHSQAALRLLSGRRRLIAPDLLIAEFGNLTWKRVRRREMMREDAALLIRDFLRLPVGIMPSTPLLPSALELALANSRTVYDCLYLALALDQEAVLVTADRRFIRALTDSPLARHIRLIG